jgi:hypothetical protein
MRGSAASTSARTNIDSDLDILKKKSNSSIGRASPVASAIVK